MAKSREKVQQLGFWDPEVLKPDHDTICLWAYENADMIFQTVCPELFDHPWLDSEVHYDREYRDQSATDLARAFMDANSRPNPRVCSRTFEFVLTSFTGYKDKLERNVGFADLLFQTQLPSVGPRYKAATTRGEDDEFDGFEIRWSRGPCILVEAKMAIPSLGELLRQINLYRTAFSGKFVVVSPEDRFSTILVEQGVTFIKYVPN